MIETTCNSTLEMLRIEPGTESLIVGPLTFHDLALIVSGGCAIIAIFLSVYLAFMHAINYTKPNEQRHIIRILFMVPVYSVSCFLQVYYYYHAVYFQVLSDCYEAFAIASFFALMCSYVGPDLHEQKEFFRNMYPIKKWVWPVNWFAACCGGQRGPWRTPKSGLTWFNINWIGIYHYCVIRVAMTIIAVVTQYFERYCESSNSPAFAHIWILAINCVAVFIAMYCVIQCYVQLKEPLDEHRPFLKVLAIKLVVFFAFWQVTAISVATSERFKIFEPNSIIAYPDIKVSIPAMLLCVEMVIFSILHFWAYPYSPYVPGAKTTYYPHPDSRKADLLPARENPHSPPSGGPLGVWAFLHAANTWDYVKAFGRGIRWLFFGVRNRKNDPSYKNRNMSSLDLDNLAAKGDLQPARSTEHLPIADQFRRSKFGLPVANGEGDAQMANEDENTGLISHAQPNPTSARYSRNLTSPRAPPSPYEDGAYSHSPSPYRDIAASPLPSPYTPHARSPVRSPVEPSRRIERQQSDDWDPIQPRNPRAPQGYGEAV